MRPGLFLSIGVLIALFVYSCGGNPNYMPESSYPGTTIVEDLVENARVEENSINPEDYEATLDVDKKISSHLSGVMSVWIGYSEYKRSLSRNRERDSITISSSLGQYAKITPIAPDFKVEPNESRCIKIDPTGSKVQFALTPNEGARGKTVVSATIELYDCEDCTGTPVPKSLETLTVSIKVNRMLELFDVFWKEFIALFTALLAIGSGIVIYKVKKKTGIDLENVKN